MCLLPGSIPVILYQFLGEVQHGHTLDSAPGSSETPRDSKSSSHNRRWGASCFGSVQRREASEHDTQEWIHHRHDKYGGPDHGLEDASSVTSSGVFTAYSTIDNSLLVASCDSGQQQQQQQQQPPSPIDNPSKCELPSTSQPQTSQPPLTVAMDRRSDYHYSRPESSRQWSEEAVRGSHESSFARTPATSSPRDQATSWRRPSPNSYDTRQTMVNQWLGQQSSHDPSMVMDAVSDMTTPTTSPAISDSATFPSRHADSYQTRAVSNEFLAPPSRTSLSHRHFDQSPSSSSREPTYRSMEHRPVDYRPVDYRSVDYRHANYPSADQDLRGVGAFADTDSSRRKVNYKPLSNWFGLWLPPHE